MYVHVLMRDEKEGRKKQARSYKQQGKATQHTQGSQFSNVVVGRGDLVTHCTISLSFPQYPQGNGNSQNPAAYPTGASIHSGHVNPLHSQQPPQQRLANGLMPGGGGGGGGEVGGDVMFHGGGGGHLVLAEVTV